jgi:putative membrane protein
MQPEPTPPPTHVETEALRRTHPATVAVKSARSLMQLLFFLIIFVFFSSGELPGGMSPAVIALIGVIGTIVTSALAWVSWSVFRYGIVGKDLVITSGLLVHKRTTIPLARVQGVNIRADVFMRALGLAELRVQTAGGGDEPEAKIGSIPLADAEVLRTALLRGHKTEQEAAGTDAENSIFGADPASRMSDFRGALGGAEVAREAATFEWALSIGRLLLAAITSKQITIIFLIAFGASGQLAQFVGPQVFEQAAEVVSMLAVPALIALVLVGVVIGLAIAVVVTSVRTWGFVARRVSNRVETEAGLLERRMTALPVRRVQAVVIEETWIRRWLGYAAVFVETAGFGQEDTDKSGLSKAAIVPLAKRGELLPLLHGLLPEASTLPAAHELPGRSLRFYIFAPTAVAFLIALPIVTILAFFYPPGAIASGATALFVALIVAGVRALNWKAAGLGMGEDCISIRSGVIGRKIVRLGRNRIQSLSVRQNPFQRRAGLATLTASSVSGASEATHSVSHLPLADAQRAVGWFHEGIRTTTRPAYVSDSSSAPPPTSS